MATPPSMPISEAILPDSTIRSTSSAVQASSRSLGILRDQAMHQVDLLGDRPRWVRMLAGDVDRPELGLHAPLAKPGNVGLAGDRAAWTGRTWSAPCPLRSAAARAGRCGRPRAGPRHGSCGPGPRPGASDRRREPAPVSQAPGPAPGKENRHNAAHRPAHGVLLRDCEVMLPGRVSILGKNGSRDNRHAREIPGDAAWSGP